MSLVGELWFRKFDLGLGCWEEETVGDLKGINKNGTILLKTNLQSFVL